MRPTLHGIAAGLGAIAVAAVASSGSSLAAPDPTPPAPARTPAPSSSSAAPASGASEAQARALFDKAVAALGGREKIAAVREVRTHGQVTAQTDSGEMSMSMETTMVFPDRLAQQVDGPYGRFTMIATPAGAYIRTDLGPKDLPNPMRDELLRQVTRTAFFLVQKADDPQFKLALGGEEKVGDVTTRALDVSYGGVAARWFVDPATGRILRSSHDSISPAGKTVHVVSDFSDFKTSDGLTSALQDPGEDRGRGRPDRRPRGGQGQPGRRPRPLREAARAGADAGHEGFAHADLQARGLTPQRLGGEQVLGAVLPSKRSRIHWIALVAEIRAARMWAAPCSSS